MKKALLLLLVGGVEQAPKGMKIRGEHFLEFINLLLNSRPSSRLFSVSLREIKVVPVANHNSTIQN